MELKIHPVTWDLSPIRALFAEYWSQFGFTPCFQGFSDELASLPGAYAPPAGRLAIAYLDDQPAGCIALRPLDAATCEVKRLYVKPEFRGHGIARRLLDWLIAEARQAGYKTMVGDTLPVMSDALALYDRYGFERTGPYSADPTPGAIFIRYDLA